jgi:hypothetical protein
MTQAAAYRSARSRAFLLVDVRPYRRHRGRLLHADRVFLGRLWTPLVRVRVRRARLADGGTEI